MGGANSVPEKPKNNSPKKIEIPVALRLEITELYVQIRTLNQQPWRNRKTQLLLALNTVKSIRGIPKPYPDDLKVDGFLSEKVTIFEFAQNSVIKLITDIINEIEAILKNTTTITQKQNLLETIQNESNALEELILAQYQNQYPDHFKINGLPLTQQVQKGFIALVQKLQARVNEILESFPGPKKETSKQELKEEAKALTEYFKKTNKDLYPDVYKVKIPPYLSKILSYKEEKEHSESNIFTLGTIEEYVLHFFPNQPQLSSPHSQKRRKVRNPLLSDSDVDSDSEAPDSDSEVSSDSENEDAAPRRRMDPRDETSLAALRQTFEARSKKTKRPASFNSGVDSDLETDDGMTYDSDSEAAEDSGSRFR